MLVKPKLEVVSGVLPEPVGEYGLQMKEMVIKPDTGEFVPLFVTNISRQSLSVEADQEVGQANLWEDGAQQGEVDARVDDVSNEMLS